MELGELFRSILDLPPEQELRDELSQATLGNWDSMAHINLITAVEEIYHISFATDEIPLLTSLGALRKALQAKGVAV